MVQRPENNLEFLIEITALLAGIFSVHLLKLETLEIAHAHINNP
jgi:hypothetical protein